MGRLEEFCQHPDGPNNHEHEKAREDVPQAGDVRPVFWMQIGLERVIESAQDNQKNGATEPRKVAAQKFLGLREMFRREPVALVRKVDQLRRHRRDNAWNSKPDHRGEHARGEKDPKESRFCLPTVRYAVGVKMRGYHAGQLRVIDQNLSGGSSHQEPKDKTRKTSVSHRFFLEATATMHPWQFCAQKRCRPSYERAATLRARTSSEVSP